MRLLQFGVMAAAGALLAACGSATTDTTTAPESTDQEVRVIPARIVAQDVSAGEPWTTSRLTTDRELALLAPDGEVDWDNDVLFAFTLAESGSCPFGEVERVEYSIAHQLLYPVVPLADDVDTCTDDANPHTVVIAISHNDLPEGGFSIWVNADEPPSGVVDGVTRFAAGELDPGDLVSGEFEALDFEGTLAVGETKIAYDVTTHCGLNRIFLTIDGRDWVLTEDEASAENIDYIPEPWRPYVTGEAIDLVIEHAERDVLLVTAAGSDHTLRYVPASDQVGCD